MDCALVTVWACFSWSNLYLDGGLSYQDVGVYREQYRFFDSVTIHQGGILIRDSFESSRTIRVRENPYGRIAVGHLMRFDGDFGVVEFSAEAFHQSSLADGNDRGFNGVSISGKWFPFAH